MFICPVCKKSINVTPYNPPRVLIHGEGNCVERWKALPEKTKARLRAEALGIPYSEPQPTQGPISSKRKQTPELCWKLRKIGRRKAATLLKLNRNTVSRWIDRGNIPQKYQEAVANL